MVINECIMKPKNNAYTNILNLLSTFISNPINCVVSCPEMTLGRKETHFFNLKMHSTHFMYDYMALDIW